MRKSVLNIAVLLSVSTSLSACSLMPDYLRPHAPVAISWSDSASYDAAASLALAHNLSWQAFYRDPALRQVVKTVLENNKDLKLAALNIKEARALYRIERADILPAVNANAGASNVKTSDQSSATGRGATSESYSANLGIASYELDLFGRLSSQNQAALNEYLATEAARSVVQNSLIAESVNAYLQLLANKKLLSLTQQTLDAQQRTYDILAQSRDSGIATGSDVARAQTAVEMARVNLFKYRRLVQQNKNALTLLMGVAYSDALIPEAVLADLVLPDNLNAGIPAQVLTLRPDVRQAEYALLARNADIGAARAAFFPSISLTGAYGFASDDLSNLFASGAFGAWSFIPQITLPIFKAGENKANLDLSKIRKEQAIVTYEKTVQTAFSEVADELAARATLTAQLDAQYRLVEAAQSVYDISHARYKSGIDSFLNVLDAQRELYAFEQSAIELERSRFSNLVDLYKVLGGGSGGK
jgi:multidrug efflux system outer membrane protein|tara:strand:+ start:10301 stop:11722 length:1422 start_codon:yes stop_codon:yes gene_type:complete